MSGGVRDDFLEETVFVLKGYIGVHQKEKREYDILGRRRVCAKAWNYEIACLV